MEPSSVADAVSSALVLPTPTGLPSPGELAELGGGVDEVELRGELDAVADEALMARTEGLGLAEAARNERFPALRQFHQDLRDSMFVEIPRDLQPWVDGLRDPSRAEGHVALGQALTALAHPEPEPEAIESQDDEFTALAPLATDRQRALSELLIFEAVRLRLLVSAWQSEAFERLGGEETDVDDIAWEEVEALIADPALLLPEVRPLQLIFASASVSLARDAAERADELRQVSGDVRDELDMRAKLRAALRELRLTESVLLENALSNLLGNDRQELRDLQVNRPVALEGLSRQAMDQRVSRGRRALSRASSSWPRRRRPALVDLFQD